MESNTCVRYRWCEHTLDEMRKDGIDKLDVIAMPKRCKVVRVEQNRFEETWNAEGGDCDGNPITAVVVAYEDRITIKVVTSWRRSR